MLERVLPRHRCLAAQLDVLPHRQGVEELHPLERAAQTLARPGLRRRGRDVLTEQEDLALGRADQTGAGVERRRLPGAVRPDQTGDPTAGGLQGLTVDGDETTEADDDSFTGEPVDVVADASGCRIHDAPSKLIIARSTSPFAVASSASFTWSRV